ncbi:MAG: FAD-binding oxidoreductase [Gemmatimonadaceae bacterium]|nr:FAD-binding oxidoreductase [Gemmatimonadaceae bacterium]
MTQLLDTPSPSTVPLVDPGMLRSLRPLLRGDVIATDDPGYDEARAIWNGMINRRPAAIARCLGVADVLAALQFAREHGLAVSVRSGGHNIAGLAVSDGSLMIDLSRMRGVRVDPSARTAHAHAGCLLSDVDRETQVHGLAAVLGFISTTGIAGLTLGGGFGYLTRRFGWTCDTVRSMEVVTADGRIVQASEKENRDLFWGLRGGGGNFGVVTSFEYQLYPVGPQIFGGALAWRGEDAPVILEAYRNLLSTAPPEMTCVAALRRAPPAPWLAKEVHGQPIIALFICHTGEPERAEALLAPLRALRVPVGDTVQRRSYLSQQTMLDATQPKGRRYYWKSEYLSTLDPAMLAPLLDHAARIASPHSAILLFPLDGAIASLPDDHSATGNRDAGLVLNIAAAWDDDAQDAGNIAWARAAWQDMRPFSTGGAYINFQTDDEGEERIRAAYGANYERLAEVKSRWDPDNVFRMNKNIAPRP